MRLLILYLIIVGLAIAAEKVRPQCSMASCAAWNRLGV
jgi:hypothetical protein